MNFDIALLLAQDGLTNGAIYTLLALALVLVFTVTRVIFVPQGDFVCYGALTLAELQLGKLPGTVWLLVSIGFIVAIVDVSMAVYRSQFHRISGVVARNVALPLVVAGTAYWLAPQKLGLWTQIALTLAIIVPLGPMIYRLAFQPLANASVLVLMIAAMAVHFAMLGLGLIFFGAEGARTPEFTDLRYHLAVMNISGQSLFVICGSMTLIATLYVFFGQTLYGKSLRAISINRVGSRLVGIRTPLAGKLSFLLAATIGSASGILVAPLTTMYYDTGFLFSLKGFVAAIFGGLTSYPIAAAAAIIVGIVESFASFWASPFKEVIIFTLMIPVLLWRNIYVRHLDELVDDEGDSTDTSASLADAHRRGWTVRWNFKRIISARLVSAIVVTLFVAVPLTLPPYYITLLDYIGLYSIVTIGLILLTGVGGLTSFGQAAFVGFGAYTSAVLTTAYGWSPWATLPVALALTAAMALVLGFITMRLSGHYLPLGTIAWGLGLYYLFGNIEILGGQTGITDLPRLEFFGMPLDDHRSYFYLIWIVVFAAGVSIQNLFNSRIGRAIRSLRGGILMAESFGVHTAHLKIVIFMYAALLATISGWLYAYLVRFVNPTPFDMNMGIEYIFMAVVGGAGYVWGAVVGATTITVLKEWLQDLLTHFFGSAGNFEVIIFGMLIVLLLQRARTGIAPLLARWLPSQRISIPNLLEAKSGLVVRTRPAPGEPLLQVQGVCKSFMSLIAVNDVTFELRAGEIIGLIGPNGAGKSTIFNLVTGVLGLTAGEIRFRGERIDNLPSREIVRRGIARTFQHVQLRTTLSVIENVAIGAHLRASRGVVSAVLRFDRTEEAMLFAEAKLQLRRVKLEEQLEKYAGGLALGQQRILEVARALAADPVVLLLDEPAAGLRYKEKQELAELLGQLRAEGLSILMIEHDMDFVMNVVDRLVVMDFGEIIAEGLPHEIQVNPVVHEAYLGGLE